MAAFSQLAEFARSYRQRPAPGVEIVATPRYHLQLIPDFPIPGPNNVSFIRCSAAEADGVIQEVRAAAAARRLPLTWILDPGTEPPDFADRLAAHGIVPEPKDELSSVMVLPAARDVDMPAGNGLAIRNGLADLESFAAAEQAAGEAFGDVPFGEPSALDALRERRFANQRATAGRHLLLATIDGEPAGAGSLTLVAPEAGIMNGGSVRPRFRGRGVYRALVSARLNIAREAGAAGLIVWGGHFSGPILARLGFETVSWRRFYIERAASD